MVQSLAALLAWPSLTLALVGNDWKFDKAPSDGFDHIAFPLNMANAPHVSGFYFAQQYNFNGVDEVGYTGIQPREDSGGQSVVHAVFSTFQGGSTTGHPNCHDGADGDAGVSCAVDVNSDYSHTYHLVVAQSGDTTWKGTLLDTVTNEQTVIGEWTLPSGAGKIQNGQVGFVEYYPWNGEPDHTCDSLPKVEAVFGNPSSTSEGAEGGATTNIHEYGDCVGKVGYSATETSDGWDIQVGF